MEAPTAEQTNVTAEQTNVTAEPRPARLSLFDLRGRWLKLRMEQERIGEEIEAAGGEYTPEQERLMDELLDEILAADMDLKDKYNSYGQVMCELEADEEALRARAALLKERARAIEARADRLRKERVRMHTRLEQDAIANNIELIEGDDFEFRVGLEKGAQRVETKVDPEDLPLNYRRETYTVRIEGEDGMLVRDLIMDIKARITPDFSLPVTVKEDIAPNLRALAKGLKEGDETAAKVAAFVPKKKVLYIK